MYYSNKKTSLKQIIANDPYLKISNCVDLSDINAGIDKLRLLDKMFGNDNKTLLNLWAKFLAKKEYLLRKNKTTLPF